LCWPRGGMLSTTQSPPFLALTDTSISSGQTGSSLILLKIRLLNSSLLLVGLVMGTPLSTRTRRAGHCVGAWGHTDCRQFPDCPESSRLVHGPLQLRSRAVSFDSRHLSVNFQQVLFGGG